MTGKKGIIALMGSGELTATMVEVHKELLRRVGNEPAARFLDTPAGFQLNSDQISERAVEFFRSRVRHPMSVASFKSKKALSPTETEKACQSLRGADYVLMGPGSPTYAVRQLRNTPIPEILSRNVQTGGCLTAASAAALIVGSFTLPVYEIYKVGSQLHWEDGLNILSRFGLRLSVVPHWNNAEGGSHDTRFCFMGKERFEKLLSLLPEEETILGIDEHTACIIDFEHRTVDFRGAGRVVLKRRDSETVFEKGDRVPLDAFMGDQAGNVHVLRKKKDVPLETERPEVPAKGTEPFWDGIHAIERQFQKCMEAKAFQKASNQLLELDRMIWQAREDLENEEFISQAREILREFAVLLGTEADLLPKSRSECISSLVEELLDLRRRYRDEKKWAEADLVRDCLQRAGIVVEDTPEGVRWRRGENDHSKPGN